MIRKTVLLVAAMLLTWHGVLMSTPHNHTHERVSQELLACSASHPTSQTDHLHGSGHMLSPHPCLACIAGTTLADNLGVREIETSAPGEMSLSPDSPDLRSRFHVRLPLMRGPPHLT